MRTILTIGEYADLASLFYLTSTALTVANLSFTVPCHELKTDHIVLYTMLFQRLPTSVVANGQKPKLDCQRKNAIQISDCSSGL